MYFHMGYTQLAPLACVFSVLRYIWGVGSLLLTRCIGGGVARAANSFTTTLPWQVVTGHTFPIACIATGKPTEHACDCVILTSLTDPTLSSLAYQLLTWVSYVASIFLPQVHTHSRGVCYAHARTIMIVYFTFAVHEDTWYVGGYAYQLLTRVTLLQRFYHKCIYALAECVLCTR